MVYKVLSIDGGGIRGIIPAMFLAEIERRTEKPIADTFDLIAGTSTGGILALGFALAGHDDKPVFNALDGVHIYGERGREVFVQRYSGFLSTIVTALFDEKYTSDGLKQILKEYFGDAQLNDVIPGVDVIIPTYDLNERKPRFFKSSRPEDHPYFMWQVALATTAAPTYFEPYHATEPPLSSETLIDGGLFANNPAMCAYAEARHNNQDDILLVSLGTGYAKDAYQWDKVRNWGQLQWILPLINIFFDGVGGAIDFQLRQILTRERYFRFQVELPNVVARLDNTAPENVAALRSYAQTMIDSANNDGTLAILSNLLRWDN